MPHGSLQDCVKIWLAAWYFWLCEYQRGMFVVASQPLGSYKRARNRKHMRSSLSMSAVAIFGTAFGAIAAPIDFVTIGAPGNAAYDGPAPFGVVGGRGRVDYQYRMGKYEITTAQWMEYVNTFSTQSNDLQFFATPVFWGAETDTTYSGPGRRYRLRSDAKADMRPVVGISWRDAARFCNWMHNGKSSSLSSLQSGAYYTSTFVTHADASWDDQATRSPGAKYWIPSLDEWIKAAHFDPNKNGGAGGWWQFSNGSDVAPVGGPPGVGTANTGFNLPSFGEFEIPLGSYSTTNAWGLFDMAGSGSEFTEEIFYGVWKERVTKGSFAGDQFYPSSNGQADRVWALGTIHPDADALYAGFRIAAAVPTVTCPRFLYQVL